MRRIRRWRLSRRGDGDIGRRGILCRQYVVCKRSEAGVVWTADAVLEGVKTLARSLPELIYSYRLELRTVSDVYGDVASCKVEVSVEKLIWWLQRRRVVALRCRELGRADCGLVASGL